MGDDESGREGGDRGIRGTGKVAAVGTFEKEGSLKWRQRSKRGRQKEAEVSKKKKTPEGINYGYQVLHAEEAACARIRLHFLGKTFSGADVTNPVRGPHTPPPRPPPSLRIGNIWRNRMFQAEILGQIVRWRSGSLSRKHLRATAAFRGFWGPVPLVRLELFLVSNRRLRLAS